MKTYKINYTAEHKNKRETLKLHKQERTASEVLMYVCCQGLTERDIDGNEHTAAEVAADWGNYMFICGMITSAYLNNVITRDEQKRANALWYMLRYGNITETRFSMG